MQTMRNSSIIIVEMEGQGWWIIECFDEENVVLGKFETEGEALQAHLRMLPYSP